MPGAVFPSLIGQGWSITRTPMWATRTQTAVSGKETRTADWSYPRYKWALTFDVLRGDGVTYAELQELMGFYNACQGSWDSFLYTDNTDNSVTNQGIGEGDGVTTVFQLVRAFGGYAEPVLAPNAVSQVTIAGTPTTAYSVDNTTGLLTFATAPASGAVLQASFSYYFRCRFMTDSVDFEQFMNNFWSVKKLEFISVK